MTQIAHEQLRSTVQWGDHVVDATVGNGHDTLFLAECVGPEGEVSGFDIQTEALHQTGLRLESAGCRGWVNLYEVGHEQMAKLLSGQAGNIRAVVFNLGYLPGSDHRVITEPKTTLAALDAALGLLCSGGLISVMIYHGHPGGVAEMQAVHMWSEGVSQTAEVEFIETEHPQAPKLLLIRKI